MKFSISEEIYKNYPGVKIGVFYAKGIITERANPRVESFVQSIEQRILSDPNSVSLDNTPAILTWRKIYQSFGCSPKKISSIESLIGRILETKKLPRINSVVDLYNGISAKYLLPMAAYNMDKIVGDMELRYSKKGEQFSPLGLKQGEKTKNGEVIYVDEQKVICRRWNNMDCDQTKITPDSTNIIFFMDGAPIVSEDSIQKALDDLSSCAQDIFGVVGKEIIISPESGRASWEIL